MASEATIRPIGDILSEAVLLLVFANNGLSNESCWNVVFGLENYADLRLQVRTLIPR